MYGDVSVRMDNGALRMKYGTAYDGTLEHWHYDTFRSAPLSPLLPSVTLHFRVDANGKVADVEFDAGAAGGGTLRRVASPPGLARQ
jgi:hypothetical protein